MRKLITISFLLSLLTSVYAGPMDINGSLREVDTLVYKQVGPGTMYCHGFITDCHENFHVLSIDLNNEYAEIETFLGNDQLHKPERVTSACDRLTKEGHDAYCGINSDFFILASDNVLPYGCPVGASIQNGLMQYAPNGGWWSVAAIDENKKVWFDYMKFNGRVILSDSSSFDFVNTNVAKRNCDLTFYNRYAGEVTPPYRVNEELSKMERTEVVVVPLKGQEWGVNKTTRVKVVRIVHNVNGGEIIGKDESVLSGIRDAKKFLDGISVGQEFNVEMNLPFHNGLKHSIKQAVGGNAVLMVDGVLTERNTSDDYNNQPYPRTAIGTSKDQRWLYLFVCDGKNVGGSPGIKTSEVCGILKHAGAWDIMGCDGGGSSEMVVNHVIANKPADGTERSVGNGWLLVSTAPEDNEISYVRFLNHKLEVPTFANYTPVVLGYNQYGKLINTDVKGFTLSCDENVGTCKDSTFTAGGKICNGNITIHFGNITQTENIRIIKSKIALRLDSVIIDQDVDYAVEVMSYTENDEMQISPENFSWKVEDENIAKINEKGILNGIANGKTNLYCSMNDFKDTITVISEINEPKMTVEKFENPGQNWNITSTSKTWNASFEKNTVKFNFTGGRNPFLQINGPMRVYSLPDSIGLSFNSSIPLKNVLIGFNYPTAEKVKVLTFENITTNKDNNITIKTSDIINDVNDLIYYPISIEYIRFTINGGDAKKSEHNIILNAIDLFYKYDRETGITPIESKDRLVIYPNPTTDVIYVNSDLVNCNYSIFTISGQCVKTGILNENSINITSLDKGSYILKVENRTNKFIINK